MVNKNHPTYAILLAFCSILLVAGTLYKASNTDTDWTLGNIVEKSTANDKSSIDYLDNQETLTEDLLHIRVRDTETPSCIPIDSWVPRAISPGESWEILAEEILTDTLTIQSGNCLDATPLYIGQIILLPPSGTIPEQSCEKPDDWIVYEIRSGDSLIVLSWKTNIDLQELLTINCLEDTQVFLDQVIFLPQKPGTEETIIDVISEPQTSPTPILDLSNNES